MGVVLDIVLPVFGTVALGFMLARGGLFDERAGEGLTRFMYYVAIPAMLFRSLALVDLPPTVPWAYLLAFYLPSLVLFWLGMLVARLRLGWARHEHGVAGMACAYSNVILLGFPLTITAFGDASTFPLFILLATQGLLLFPLTTHVLERHGSHTGGNDPRLGSLAALAFNPIILSLGLGVAANLLSVSLADPLDRMLEILGAAGPGCALIALGISLGQRSMGGGYHEVCYFVLLKNILHPVLVFGACLALGINGDWARVAVLLAAMPTGVNAFIFAHRYATRVDAISKTVVLSTVVAVLTSTLVLSHYLT